MDVLTGGGGIWIWRPLSTGSGGGPPGPEPGTVQIPDTLPPLDELTILLTADDVEIRYGLELLSELDELIGDISDALVEGSGSVEHEGWASSGIFGSFHASLLGALDWPTARLRPYQEIQAGAYVRRWYYGIFIPTTMPEIQSGEQDEDGSELITYPIEAADKALLLDQAQVGDSYTVPAGTAVLDGVRQAIIDSGVTGSPPLLASGSTAVLSSPMVFLLNAQTPWTWLQVVNALLGSIAYEPLSTSGSGAYTSRPLQDARTATVVWTFDTSDRRTVIVRDDYKTRIDRWSTVNWWRFINKAARTTAAAEGDGYYTVDLSAGGTKRKNTLPVDAVGQAELEASGDATVAQTLQRAHARDIQTAPIPILGHLDVVRMGPEESGEFKRFQIAHWKQILDGSADCEIQMEEIV
jgi:hypothetical protein